MALDKSDLGNIDMITAQIMEEEEEEQDMVTPCLPRPIGKSALYRLFFWYLSWALPGMGMFSEAYIIFSLGEIKPFQQRMYKACFNDYKNGCVKNLVSNQNYIQICGIIAGMLFFGVFADYIGRKWGSRIVAFIMFTGCVLFTFTPFASSSPYGGYHYLCYFIVSETWYGFGVGGEYPLASSSASERAAHNKSRQHLRGREVVMTFSGQGMGNFVNSIVIIICMAIFKQTKVLLTFHGSRNVMCLQAGIGAVICLLLTLYRFMFLHESKMYVKSKTSIEEGGTMTDDPVGERLRHRRALKHFWPRVMAISIAWISNDFAFYGNKLFQSTFIGILYPGASAYLKQKYTILNSFVALVGYFFAAFFVDKPYYGRTRCQYIGFTWMFVLYIICGGAYNKLITHNGIHGFQFLYYFSSFWNQFGPNCTTWLLASECFPTDIRASYCGFNAAMGKVGAIISGVAFNYLTDRNKFYVSAAFGAFGAVVSFFFQCDTTGLELHELDRMQACVLRGEFDKYHGEAINPKHLSLFERFVLRWGRNYDPELDARDREMEMSRAVTRSLSKALTKNMSQPDLKQAEVSIGQVGDDADKEIQLTKKPSKLGFLRKKTSSKDDAPTVENGPEHASI